MNPLATFFCPDSRDTYSLFPVNPEFLQSRREAAECMVWVYQGQPVWLSNMASPTEERWSVPPVNGGDREVKARPAIAHFGLVPLTEANASN
jgi:hypothetical protein